MSYNFINEASMIRTSALCAYDSVVGYTSDFSVNGEVDGWNYFTGIHTYGCWGGFLFATLFGSYGLVGRTSIFQPVPAETNYFVKITMKINPVDRIGSQVLPITARLMWVTQSDSIWNTTKSYDFTISADNAWQSYSLNMGEKQYWQGNITNLRLYPIFSDGQSGDEFFIKSIKIISIDTFDCKNTACDYYLNYSHNCPGVGSRGYCKSSAINTSHYTVEEDINDEFIININDYGNETIKLTPVSNATGLEMSKNLTTAISKIDIGGYAEVEVDYTDDGEFLVYSGTYTTDSTVIVVNNSAARTLGFFDNDGIDLSSKGSGTNPASGFSPSSSFKIKSFQLLSLFDNNENTSFPFNPFIYSIEAGRRDLLDSGLGISKVIVGESAETGAAGPVQRENTIINNFGKTIIDFNHPFNASGRIKKISAACTLDTGWDYSLSDPPAKNYAGREEATGCKIKILRPKRNGNLEVVQSIDIPDRDYSGNRLYSFYQEHIEIDCDIWVNKGDLIGIYNANIYAGVSLSGDEVDALYYQINSEITGEFDPGELYGDGITGLLVYARSDEIQDKLTIDIDLGRRVNIDDIDITGSVENTFLEYNIARCLDMNWSVDLFDQQHKTGFIWTVCPGEYCNQTFHFLHDNIAYGIDKLNDGIKIVKDGYAGSGYTAGEDNPFNHSTLLGPPGYVAQSFVPTDPQYFFVNADSEWLGVYQHVGAERGGPFIEDFQEDPIAFTLLFSYGQTKSIYKSVIYFKEKHNFRNFALSVCTDLNDISGNADDRRFHLVSEYIAVGIDGVSIDENSYLYSSVDEYLFANPSHGEPIFEFSGEKDANGGYIGTITNYDEYIQAANIDWNVLSHEFDPIDCKGFRVYCNNHYSTKITEMELYCKVGDVGSNLVGGMTVSYSYYDELWWLASLTQNSNTSVTAFVGDTPRYFRIEIEPITDTILSNIIFNVKGEELYVGDKGCEYEIFSSHSKTNAVNAPQVINVKNIYGNNYDLYVDIAKDEENESELVFHSKMNNADSITNPEVGPDALYHKAEDYPLVNYNKNCAINCDCYGLQNLISGKKSYYSHNSGYTWHEFGTLVSGVDVDFSNITASNMTVISFPESTTRYRYWKVGWKALDHPAMNVREMTPLFYTSASIDPNDSFTGYDGETPNSTRWDLQGSPYILDNRLRLYASAGSRQDIRSNFVLVGDFDIECDFEIISRENTNTWNITLKILDDEGNIIQVQRDYRSGKNYFSGYKYIDDAGSYFASANEDYLDGKLKLIRSGDTFYVWAWYNSMWYNIGSTTETDVEEAVNVWIFAQSSSGNPTIEAHIGDFIVNSGSAEIRQDKEMACTFYHDVALAFEDGPITDTAPHLQNDSVTSSYYELEGGSNIGMDFSDHEVIDKIIWFHDAINDYDATYCGIDKYTELNIVGRDGNIVDYSYDERIFTTVGSGIYVDTNGRFDIIVTEVTAANGLYGADTSPTNTTIPTKATLVDGELYPTYADNTCKISSGYSVGIDLGSSKTVNKLRFHASSDHSGVPYFMRVYTGVKTYYIYKSNDNISWTLAETYNDHSLDTGFPAIVTAGGTSGYRHGYFEFEFPASHSARYFKVWCQKSIIWRAGSESVPWINEIKAYVYNSDPTSETAIRFSGHSDSYISVPASSAFVFPGDTYAPIEGDFDAFTIDFYVKFNSLPANDGDYCTLLRNWSDTITTSLGTYTFPPDRSLHNTRVETNDYGWPAVNYAIFVRNVSGTCYIEFWTQTKDPAGWFGGGYKWTRGSSTVNDPVVVVGETYYVSFEREEPPDETPIYCYVNGFNYCSGMIGQRSGLSPYCQPIKIGQGLDGWMSDVRITKGLRRIPPRDGLVAAQAHAKRTDIAIANERYYTMSLYTSSDNIYYAKYDDVDLYYDNSYSHHSANSIFSSDYYSYLAIDLEKRYDLELLRSYGTGSPYQTEISIDGTNVAYSNSDVSDVYDVEFESDKNDARWMRLQLLSGDGTSRTFKKLGLYPDISTRISPAGGNYNHEWDYLGKSITAYESSTNLALGATVSGSSYFGTMYLDKITDGIINSNTTSETVSLYDVWGSDGETNPWIYVDLGAVYSIYRVKIYHGYDGEDNNYLITDYNIQVSTDEETFTTIFSVSSNTSFERTHDLTSAVQARYVKIAITGYDCDPYVFLRPDSTGTSGNIELFTGAVLRELEVYEDYGYPIIDSEEYPIVCMNLGDQFFLSSHSIVGIDVEDTSTDWSNSNSNFCYSDSILDSPSKVDFREWGESPYYDQWAVIRMDTATGYNSGPDYLKHVRFICTYDQNPCNYPWWWSSNISIISRDYSYDVYNSISTLKIEYPASTAADTISFVEGDDFGVDSIASWRDGFSFRFRIDDVDNLDRSYGYFYFGGYDSSSTANPVIYKWYFSTISGSLNTGWNQLFLRPKMADEIEYTEQEIGGTDFRAISTVTLGTMGMVFKGVGNPLTMHLDGFEIERNTFHDYSAHGVGCYITENDYITAPIGECSLTRGTIEFWIRPDYDYNSFDYYNVARNRAIFNFNNNANDIFGLMVTSNGLEIYHGNINDILNVQSVSGLGISILDTMFHLGIVFSNDGTQIDNDGSTIRIYINNVLIFKTTSTWEIGDNKHFSFIFGGKGSLSVKSGGYVETSGVDAVISDLKIYNYCKTDFLESALDNEDAADKLIKPSNFIEISKDNLTYYSVGDTALPLTFSGIAADVSVPVYVRTTLPAGLTGKESRTSGLLIYWDVAV